MINNNCNQASALVLWGNVDLGTDVIDKQVRRLFLHPCPEPSASIRQTREWWRRGGVRKTLIETETGMEKMLQLQKSSAGHIIPVLFKLQRSYSIQMCTDLGVSTHASASLSRDGQRGQTGQST